MATCLANGVVYGIAFSASTKSNSGKTIEEIYLYQSDSP
jgi:hypothetical protein